ncbi:hypothetical protein PSYPI_26104 [Pseudomonas syringae pv. pisi str. 1704B]|uniref:DUF5943 domain-containing protein n=1 Tax=Pseudomonas syringae pv. pisi str. 1704B TaxID=629263 RepID=F3GET6_PSESJ|nr:hypothetical protein PSYPI_26104 [Pseudomonas syringae pv. pisi str. 1704B]
MAKIAPQLPIEVDSETGVWTSDALPMLYVPRHFFVNNHRGIEEVLGGRCLRRHPLQGGLQIRLALVRKGGRMPWPGRRCGVRALHEAPVAARLGPVKIQDIDIEKGTASVKLEHSCFVYVYGKVGRKVDYMFTGWFAGAMDQILAASGSAVRTVAEQVYGGSEEGHDDGLFVVKPL